MFYQFHNPHRKATIKSTAAVRSLQPTKKLIRSSNGQFTIIFLQILYIKMSSNRLKKLRTLTSLETDCTYEDNHDTGIKINILQPSTRKIDTHSSFQTPIKETAAEDELPPQNNPDRKLMNIPELSKKHGDTYLLTSSNNSEPPPSSANSKTHLKTSRNHPAGQQQSIVRIETSGLASNSLNSSDMRTSNRNINKPINPKGQAPKPTANILTESLTHSAPYGRAKAELKIEKNCDFLLEVSSNESESDHEQINLDLQDEKTLKINVHNIDRKQDRPSLKNETKPQIKRSTLPAGKSERYLGVKEDRSTSRMKLRDYIYMAQASTNRASIDRHQLIQNRKTSPAPAAIPSKTITAPQAKQQPAPSSDQYPLVAPTARRQYVNAKYKITNSQMFEILKKEICQDIAAVEANLQKTAEELDDVETSGKEPTNDELLVLYNLRREVKDQIGKRVQLALDSLMKNKGNNLLKSRSRRTEDPVIEQLTCSQFLNKHRS